MEDPRPADEPSEDQDDPMVTPVDRPDGRRPASTSLEVGDVVAGYELKHAVGAGGMGRVFLARDERLDRYVALKLLPPSDADEEGQGRFLREARALARVDHENVVRVHASGVDKNVAWMALEYIEGDPLDELLGGGPLDEETALLLGAQIARGLAAVHREGVVHRDVKPGNLLIDDEGVIRVVDFGVALLTERGAGGGFITQKGVAVGTPHFMAPEQARGGAVDGRADVWGLGATVFTMLAGQPPFFTGDDDETDLDVLARVLKETAPDIRQRAAGVSAETASLLRRMLTPAAADRLDDLDEVAALLEACADHLAGGPQPHIPPAKATEDTGSDAPSSGEPSSGEPSSDEPASRTETSGPAAAAPPAVDERAGRSPWGKLAVGLAALALLAGAGGLGFFLASSGQPADDGDPLATVPDPRPTEPEAPPDEGPTAGDPVDEPGEQQAADEEPGEEPLGPDPLPTPAEIARREAAALQKTALEGGPQGERAIRRLVDLDTEPAQEALLTVVQSRRGAAAIAAIDRQRAVHHLETLTWALLHGERPKSLGAVRALANIRNTEALELLQAAESGHDDPAVREAARRGRRSIFSVEGEEPERAP